MQIDTHIKPAQLLPALARVFDLGAAKVRAIDRAWDPARGAPVYTVEGTYTSRGWTEWTQGFQYGCAILVFDGIDDRALLKLARRHTVEEMARHITHMGVHDHGFNNLSTYGNLRRLMLEGRFLHDEWELAFYELALKASAAVQTSRWANAAPPPAGYLPPGPPTGAAGSGPPFGYIYSFNGPQSLFIDTMRTLRILGVGHQMGHVLMGENDRRINLLQRLAAHGLTTAAYSIYYGDDRDGYDTEEMCGRTAHEAIFNPNDGAFRCPSSQQGYSPFTTWTRGLAWAMLGFAEQVEFLHTLDAAAFKAATGYSKPLVQRIFERAARATCHFYITKAAALDGIPYWDTGAPGLYKLRDWRGRPADPFNLHEPVDSSAAAIAAQGLIRLGRHLGAQNGRHYLQAGLTIAHTLFAEPYLSTAAAHQGLLLHSVYHRPNGWDHIPPGRKVPCGESSMWGDYHALELAVLIQRLAKKGPYLTFFDA